MSKIKDWIIDHPGETLVNLDNPKENPFRFQPKGHPRFSDMTHEELVEDRDGHYEGEPVGGWPSFYD